MHNESEMDWWVLCLVIHAFVEVWAGDRDDSAAVEWPVTRHDAPDSVVVEVHVLLCVLLAVEAQRHAALCRMPYNFFF